MRGPLNRGALKIHMDLCTLRTTHVRARSADRARSACAGPPGPYYIDVCVYIYIERERYTYIHIHTYTYTYTDTDTATDTLTYTYTYTYTYGGRKQFCNF